MSKRRHHSAARFSQRQRTGKESNAAAKAHRPCELLEMRQMLCGASWHVDPPTTPIEVKPDLVAPSRGGPEANDPANIIWTNRGAASDGFDARFGATAPTARAVVDAVIDYYELMIGSFNYTAAGQTYSLSLSMAAAGSGFGASANLTSSLNGKPKGGSITMGAGNNSADPNDANGWFIDPTPYDNSEFMGNIVNAFSGDAQAGSPAAGKGDFFTVVAAEMTHTMGLFGSALAGWFSRTTNTGIADTAEGGGIGTFWTFNGASIDHLLTSNNGGGGGQNFGSAVHGAGPGVNVPFGPNVYVGAQDQGNAVYEFGRRYMVNNTFSLMFKDAYGYSSINPAKFGTFYSSPFDSTTGVVTVRGGTGTSNDNIQIFRSAGNTLTVAVDVGNDVAGTGSLPGAGNLPAFVSVYDISQVSSIVVDAGAGDDVIFIDTTNFNAGVTLAENITINAGAGNDSLTTTFFGANLDYLTGALSFDGGTGTDSITIYDNGATFGDTYAITNSFIDRVVFGGLTYSGSESLFLNAESGNNTFNIAGTLPGMTYTLDGRAGNDTFNVGTVGGNAEGIDGPLTVIGNTGIDTVNYNDLTAAGAPGYTLNSTQIIRSFNATLTYDTAEAIRIDAGAGNNSILLNDLLPVFDPASLVVNGNDGNDSIQVELNQQRSGSTTPITVDGGAGSDLVTINTTLSATGTFGVPSLYNNAFITPTARTVNYSTFEALVCNVLYTEARSFFILSTAATTPVTINGGTNRDFFQVGGLPGFVGTVTLDNILGPVTLNGNGELDTVSLNDQSTSLANTYTLNATTFSRSGAALVTYATSEAVVINAGDGADTINIVDHPAAVSVTVDGRGGLDDVNVNSDAVGTATVNFPTTQDLVSLDIFAGGSAVLAASGDKVIDTDGLTVAATGKLDLNDNDLIVDYTGASQRATVQALINSGRAGGAWSGNGITSTAAKNANPRNTTLGVLDSSLFKTLYGAAATFAGRTIDTTAVLVKYTYYGDTDFSGVVDFDDYSRIDAGYSANRTGWFNGDFDGSGGVNFDDYSLIDLAFNTQNGLL